MEEENILPLVKYGGGGVMFWGCVTWMGIGPLVPIHGPLDGDDYAQILMDNIPQAKAALNVQSAYIIEDGAAIHGTPKELDAKDQLSLRDLDLPPYSPDLNIIENVWSLLKTKVANRAPRSVEQLEEIALEEWETISVEEIRTYFYSIPSRLENVISSQGGNTKY